MTEDKLFWCEGTVQQAILEVKLKFHKTTALWCVGHSCTLEDHGYISRSAINFLLTLLSELFPLALSIRCLRN